MTSKGRFAFVLAGTLAFAACADDEDLKDTRPTDGDVSDVVGIDVDNDSSPDDTGTVDMDGGIDSTIGDTGAPTDTGSPGTDTGTLATDTGTPVTDTGIIITETGSFDTGTLVTDTGTVAMDTGPFDTGPFDTGMVTMDTGPFDTGPFDTGMVTMDTGPFDTGPFDTGMVTMDTGPFDTGPFDTGMVAMDTGPFDTGPFDTGSAPDFGLESAVDETGASLDGTAKATFSRGITIDGANDFTPSETFATTSGGYTAYVTWDSSYVYVGYSGFDIGPGASSSKWIVVHIDGLLGAGATRDEQYGMQQHLFPTGFDSDLYFAWKTDGSYQQLKTWNGAAWVTSLAPVATAKSGSYVEMAIPLSSLGTPNKLGITSYMINEGSGEWTYAGLYSDSFIDGYSAVGTPTTIQHWVDGFGGTAQPNDPSRKKP